MIIRPVTENDFPGVARLISVVFSEDLQKVTGRVVNEVLLLPSVKMYKTTFIVEEKNAILGAIIISKRKLSFPLSLILFYLKNFGLLASLRSYLNLTTFRKKMPKKMDNEYFIEAVAVDESARNRGIGKELVASAEGTLKERNAKYLGLVVRTENPAIEFYEALGFVKIKECATHALGEWYYMRKTL